MYDVVVGRSESDKEKWGSKGTILIGKHYVQMGRTTSLSNNIYLDVARSHVVFVCGKRGSGKSYTMGVITEGISDLPSEIKQNISVIMLDTMGIYWTMKYPNLKDKELLREWGMEPKGLNVTIYTPTGYFAKYREEGIPTDFPFSIKPSELDANDWNLTFGLDAHDAVAIFIEKIMYDLREESEDLSYDLDDVIKRIEQDKEFDDTVKVAAKNHFVNAKNWGVFDREGTPLSDLARPGQVTVLDVSCYATQPNSWNIKNLVIGLVAEKLFIHRMLARKDEEYHAIHESVNFFGDEQAQKQEFPLVWLVIDEAHEFLPVSGKTVATDPLVTILREGRQPGISLILATQQPGKIHTDVMTQSDTVIAHRITAKLDTEALGALMQNYMRTGLTQELDALPRVKGAAIIFDDNNEKMYPIRLRPRLTWHGGEDPAAIRAQVENELP